MDGIFEKKNDRERNGSFGKNNFQNRKNRRGTERSGENGGRRDGFVKTGSDYQSREQKRRYDLRNTDDESVEDVKRDAEKIEEEIKLEISEIKSLQIDFFGI